MALNIYDVSEKAGVSIATVSRVLNSSPNVSEKTRNKILAVMDEMGYTPNVFARGLGLGTIKTIGIMCSDSSDPYLAQAIYHLESRLRSNGYDSILCCTGTQLERKQKYFHLLLSKKVDAIILVGSKFIEMKPKDNAYIIKASGDIPIMLVNGYLEGENIYCTLCDDTAATFHAAEQLILSGCGNILYLYSSHSHSGVNKLTGYKNALKKHRIAIRDELICQCPKDVLTAKELLLKLHEGGQQFDAVLSSDDTLAVGSVKFAHTIHKSIPEQLSIIGYNNSAYAVCTDPEITSIDSKVEALCTTTVQTLMGIFNDENVPAKTIVAAELIKRATTKF